MGDDIDCERWTIDVGDEDHGVFLVTWRSWCLFVDFFLFCVNVLIYLIKKKSSESKIKLKKLTIYIQHATWFKNVYLTYHISLSICICRV